MITYIINFVICSGMLLLVYRAFLGTENLYRFNRFYLLFSLLFSLIVPATTIHVPYVSMPDWDKLIVNKPAAVIADRHAPEQTTTKPMPIVVDEPVQAQTAAPAFIEANGNADNYTTTPSIPQVAISAATRNEAVPTPQSTHNYLPEILLALYSLITMVLLSRFVWNSYHISRLVASSTIIDYQDTKLVLVTDDVTPHSFLKYVFLNKAAYYNKTIEPEIICHEQTHVRQLHSLDVIWVEILQIVCWFNFFIPLYRKAIQLNHEFLADEAVIENYQDTPAYQYLLLAKASQSGSLYLTSQFNYLVTKKRIVMMTKRTTAAIAFYKRLALLPVLAVAIFLFSQKSLAQNAKKAQPEKKQAVAKKVKSQTQASTPGTAVEAAKQDAPQSVLDEYTKIVTRYGIPYKKGEKVDYTPDFSAADKERLTTLYKQMSHNQQQHQYIRLAHLFPPPMVWFNISDTVNWQHKTIYVNDKKVTIAELSKFKKKLGYTISIKSLTKQEVRLCTSDYYKKQTEALPKLVFIYIPKSRWKYNNWPIGGIVPVNNQIQAVSVNRQDAPQSVLDEYAKIEKKYREYNPNLTATAHLKNPYIKTWTITARDKARLMALYGQMSPRQQSKQDVKFYPREPFMSKISPTAEELNNWKDAKKYTVRVNYRIIKNKDLDKYQPTDFDYYTVTPYASFGLKRDRKEVRLITRAEYANAYKKYAADTSRYDFGVQILPPVFIPLIVVDGVPFNNPLHKELYAFDFKKTSNANYARLLGIDTLDILSISVLKGETGKTAWESRGENGVIVITTKKGTVSANDNNKQTDAEINRSIDKDRQPLVIIDGKTVDKHIPADFNYATASNNEYATVLSIKPSDIATISILKGVANTKVWGERAANGVLLITTKNANHQNKSQN